MRRIPWLVMAVLTALLVTSCGSGGSSSSDGSSTTLRVTRDGPIFPVFHPARATDNTYPLLYLIYDNLVHLDPDETTVTPDLAESWEVSPDAKTFTFKLGTGIKWQDGEPFTAEDVAFTAWWAARYPDAYQGLPAVWSQVEGAEETASSGADLAGVKVISDTEISFTLSEPNIYFLPSLANAPNVIVPKHVLEKETADTIEKIDATTRTPIGTGPFKLTDYKADQYVEFKANPDYFRGAPKLDTIIWKILAGDQIATQVEAGQLDLALGLDQQYRDTLKSVSGIDLVDATSVGMNGLFVRTDNPALEDPRVRQALYYGIDRQGIIDSVLNGIPKLLWNPPGLNFDSLNQYPHDPDKARQLLQQAGWDKSTKLNLVYWKDAANAGKVLPIVQQQLAEIGVTVKLNPLEIDDWDDMVTNPDRRDQWDLDFEFGGTYGLGPDQSSRSYGSCKGPKVQSGFQDCKLADLFTQARGTTDDAKREGMYQEIARIINENADVIYLWQPVLLNPMSTKLDNVEIYPFDRHSFMRANEWSMG